MKKIRKVLSLILICMMALSLMLPIVGAAENGQANVKAEEEAVLGSTTDSTPGKETSNLQENPTSGIVLSDSWIGLAVGESYVLTYNLLWDEAESSEVEWRSNNPEIATVEAGVVTAAAAGKTEVTAYRADDNSVAAICAVEVWPSLPIMTPMAAAFNGNISEKVAVSIGRIPTINVDVPAYTNVQLATIVLTEGEEYSDAFASGDYFFLNLPSGMMWQNNPIVPGDYVRIEEWNGSAWELTQAQNITAVRTAASILYVQVNTAVPYKRERIVIESMVQVNGYRESTIEVTLQDIDGVIPSGSWVIGRTAQQPIPGITYDNYVTGLPVVRAGTLAQAGGSITIMESSSGSLQSGEFTLRLPQYVAWDSMDIGKISSNNAFAGFTVDTVKVKDNTEGRDLEVKITVEAERNHPAACFDIDTSIIVDPLFASEAVEISLIEGTTGVSTNWKNDNQVIALVKGSIKVDIARIVVVDTNVPSNTPATLGLISIVEEADAADAFQPGDYFSVTLPDGIAWQNQSPIAYVEFQSFQTGIEAWVSVPGILSVSRVNATTLRVELSGLNGSQALTRDRILIDPRVILNNFSGSEITAAIEDVNSTSLIPEGNWLIANTPSTGIIVEAVTTPTVGEGLRTLGVIRITENNPFEFQTGTQITLTLPKEIAWNSQMWNGGSMVRALGGFMNPNLTAAIDPSEPRRLIVTVQNAGSSRTHRGIIEVSTPVMISTQAAFGDIEVKIDNNMGMPSENLVIGRYEDYELSFITPVIPELTAGQTGQFGGILQLSENLPGILPANRNITITLPDGVEIAAGGAEVKVIKGSNIIASPLIEFDKVIIPLAQSSMSAATIEIRFNQLDVADDFAGDVIVNISGSGYNNAGILEDVKIASVPVSGSDPSEPDPSEPDPSEPDPSEPDPSEPDPSDKNLDQILEDAKNGAASADDIMEVLKGISSSDIEEALQNEESLDQLKELEDIYKGQTNVNVGISVAPNTHGNFANAEMLNRIEVVGAAFNAAPGSTVTLSFSKPDKDAEVDETKYQKNNAIQFEIKLEGVADSSQLEVPISITIPIPTGINPDDFQILHYRSDGTYEVINPLNNGDGTCTFVITHFSTFVFVNPVTVPPSSSGGGGGSGSAPVPSGSFSGSNHYVAESGETIVYILQKDFSLFDRVAAGNTTLTLGRDYEAESGSTKITVLPAYLDTLNAGDHNLTVYFKDGVSAAMKFTVAEAVNPPQTTIAPQPIRPQNPFGDVKEGDWYYDAVQYVYEQNLMSGVSANVFSPNTSLTRGMIVVVLYRLAGSPDTGNISSPFSDVSSGIWYSDAVKWAAGNGIAAGYENGQFGPEDKITREQLASIIYRYQQFSRQIPDSILPDREFADESSISKYAKDSIRALIRQGIINGKSDNLFDPAGNATRAEFASMLYQFLKAVN